jgi:hypothetical protein
MAFDEEDFVRRLREDGLDRLADRGQRLELRWRDRGAAEIIRTTCRP